MNNRRINIIIGIAASVLAIVSILVLFATAFGSSDTYGYPSSLGSCYNVMFGRNGYDMVPWLIVAFSFQIAAAVFALVGAVLPGKLGMFNLGFSGLLIAAAAILWFLSPTLFLSVNKMYMEAESVVLGTGSIIAGVSAAVSALLCFYGAYRIAKN